MNSLLKTLTWLTAFGACALNCQQLSAQSKEAEPATRAANDAFVKSLPFSDRSDLAAAQQGRRHRFEFRGRLFGPAKSIYNVAVERVPLTMSRKPGGC
jgi:hypothetical protein